MEKYICPECEVEMTEEEGLYWCDECGINNDSKAYEDLKNSKSRGNNHKDNWNWVNE